MVLGGRSWVGYRLAEQLHQSGWKVLCTTSGKPPRPSFAADSAHPCGYVQNTGGESVGQLIDMEQPEAVINLRIGITEHDFLTHKIAANAAERANALYVYASSALALDGYEGEPLVESLPPKSISEYGQFKQRCENDLRQRAELAFLILRFSSLHGWSPWKDTRTVSLLKKMAANEVIVVNRGVVQNRCSDTVFAEIVAGLISKRSNGVAHVGTSDSSEELDFLKRLATAFGYSPTNIQPGVERAVNLAVIPQLGLHRYGPLTEADTLAQLVASKHLAPYRRSKLTGEVPT